MEKLSFETTILENGVIHVPDYNKFMNKRVQIVVTVKETNNELKEKQKILDEFFGKWGGYFPARLMKKTIDIII